MTTYLAILALCLLVTTGPIIALVCYALYRSERRKVQALRRDIQCYNAALDKACLEVLQLRQQPRVILAKPCACAGLPQASELISVN